MVPALLEVTDLACRRGGRRVFGGLSFALAAGDLLALTGRNGSGKTTLLRALALLVPTDAGSIRWQGEEVAADPDRWRGQIAWLGHLDGLKGDLTVRENLLASVRDRTRLESALAAFDLAPLAGTLLVGTPTLSLIGWLAAALTLGARKSGALLALLALPLCVPTLIFGAGAVEATVSGQGFGVHLAILAALALMALATTPWAMAAALRQAGE